MSSQFANALEREDVGFVTGGDHARSFLGVLCKPFRDAQAGAVVVPVFTFSGLRRFSIGLKIRAPSY